MSAGRGWLLCCLWAAAVPRVAAAQDMTPPEMLAPPAAVWPAGEPAREAEVVVLVEIDATGAVQGASIVFGVTPRIDAAALEAARALRFRPARWGTGAIASRLRLRIRVAPPPPAPAAERRAALAGRVLDRARGTAIAGAVVSAPGRRAEATTDAAGDFVLAIEPGTVEIRVEAAGYEAVSTTETLAVGARLEVRYGLSPQTASDYETVVTARAVRQEISRQTLQREEVTRMPGTMGDPFRVIEVLPGVVPLLTGVPYYYVRGAPPADNGTFVDGVRIPALFHLALGPSVIHPTLVDRIDFFTGGAPARFPSFVGGVVAATSAEIPRDRVHLDADVRLVDSGAMLTVPLGGGRTRLSASGRYSYTAALLTLLQEDVFVDYWDYQLRAEHDLTRRHTVNVMALGAFDRLGSIERLSDGRTSEVTAFAQVFHVLDVRSRQRLDRGRTLELAGSASLEQNLLGDDGMSGQDVTVGPRVTIAAPIGRDVDLRLGADASVKGSSFVVDEGNAAEGATPTRTLFGSGVFLEADVRLDARTTVLPGVRGSLFSANGVAHGAVDPRLGVRHELARGLTLKGNAGLYHQPPAFVIPLPGLGALDWDRGLQRSVQLSQGVEWQAPFGLSVDGQVFFHRYENLSDLVIDDPSDGSDFDPGEEDERFEDVFPRLSGNAYGLELIVRRPLTSRLFGWVAYTLSRSERLLDGVPTGDGCRPPVRRTRRALVPSDADRTHVLNLVASYELPGGFRIGGRVHFRSGRPFTRHRCWRLGDDDFRSLYGPRAGARMPVFFRLDLRVDKRWRYRGWDLELYFEMINVTFSEEVLEVEQRERTDGTVAPPDPTDETVPLVVPTLGLRAVF